MHVLFGQQTFRTLRTFMSQIERIIDSYLISRYLGSAAIQVRHVLNAGPFLVWALNDLGGGLACIAPLHKGYAVKPRFFLDLSSFLNL
jgi:hypothetical protein